jgi:hypothetical protein
MTRAGRVGGQAIFNVLPTAYVTVQPRAGTQKVQTSGGLPRHRWVYRI